ncbi:GCS-domain-containing protein, partial [Ramicandelaber brevisporus]
MGLLSLGTPLPWQEAKKHSDHVRKHGIQQLINIYHRLKDRRRDVLRWGDEVEYVVVRFDDERRLAQASLRSHEILPLLDEAPASKDPASSSSGMGITWHPEYGRFMLEATPARPYGSELADLRAVEESMNERRQVANQHLDRAAGEVALTMTSFPRLGCGADSFYAPNGGGSVQPGGPAARSLFFPDDAIYVHPRFPTLSANIRTRRQSKVAINVPVFRDTNTPWPFADPTIPAAVAGGRHPEKEDREALDGGAAKENHIYMDAMGFGMGCSCLQVTFQACSIVEARRLYDHLAVVAPLMLALTAAAPIYRGYLADVDCRWNVISAAVDDRTPYERGLVSERPGPDADDCTNGTRFVIPKSRYGSVSTYLGSGQNSATGGPNDPLFRPEYNDIPLVHDAEIKATLLANGLDEQLATHFAHLFIRDPLVVFEELLDQDDGASSDHFENIQSTNWQSMRFKPPPANSPIGWRVEFRSMEIQITDFENAAFTVFLVLLTRAFLSFGLNFYIPISKVDDNMQRAQQRGAVGGQKFWFRKNIFPSDNNASNTACPPEIVPPVDANPPKCASCGRAECISIEYEELTLDEIFNGKADGSFPGLVAVVVAYLDANNVDVETRCLFNRYIELVRRRADGTLLTDAAWMRKFVAEHPQYKHDSVVSAEIGYDLLKAVQAVASYETRVPELLGSLVR